MRHAFTIALLSTLLLATGARAQDVHESRAQPAHGSSGQGSLSRADIPRRAQVGIIYKYDAATSGSGSGDAQPPELLGRAAAVVGGTLRKAGYEVVPRAEVVTRLSATDVSCGLGGIQDCEAAAVRTALSLDAVVLVALWNGDELVIEVTTPEGIGRAKRRIGERPEAAASLTSDALGDVKNGRPVPVRVDAFPRGAEVVIDGAVVGTAPASARLSPGAHRVTLRKLSHVTTTRDIEIPRGHEGTLVVRMSMTPEGEAGHDGHDGRPDVKLVATERANPDGEPTAAWDYLVAGALVAVSVPLIASPLDALAKEGDCQGGVAADGTCDEMRFGAGAVLSLVGGAALLGGAGYVVFATPIQTSLSTDGDSVHVTTRIQF